MMSRMIFFIWIYGKMFDYTCSAQTIDHEVQSISTQHAKDVNWEFKISHKTHFP